MFIIIMTTTQGSKINIDKLRERAFQIATKPDEVHNLTPEEVVELRKYLDPLGTIINTDKKYANLSIINWRDKYLRRLIMTSMIGYLFQLSDEYTPEQQVEAEMTKYNRMINTLDSTKDKEKIAELRKECADRVRILQSTARGIIKQFLNRHFEYNPNFHVRKAPTENKDDPERKDRDEAILAACSTAEKAAAIEQTLQSKPEQMYKYMRSHTLGTYQEIVSAADEVKSSINVLIDPALTISDKHGILLKKYIALSNRANDMKKIVEPLSTSDTLAAWKAQPSANVFHQFDRYMTNNFEKLSDIVRVLYAEKPDIEFSVIYYDSYASLDDAERYREQHREEFRSEVFTVENSAVHLLGPYKENRAKMTFYNKHTDVLKHMMEQGELDTRLGADMLDKTVELEKAKNIAEAGPDSPALQTYAKLLNQAKDLGAKKVLSKEDLDRIAELKKQAQDVKEDYEVPDEAIQLYMYTPVTNEAGETVLEKKISYTQAEKPLYLDEDSPYRDKYQPKRGPGESMNDVETKTIVSRTGEKKQIQVLRSDLAASNAPNNTTSSDPMISQKSRSKK